jgi:hypothetical protein
VAATKHEQSFSGTTVVMTNRYLYDHAGRPTAIYQSIDGGSETLVSSNSYDAIGRQSSKILGSGVQTIDYGYDIRNRMTYINTPGSLGSDKFAMQLIYEGSDVSGSTPQYSGNISAVRWQQAGGSVNSYKYSYDIYNRLTSGTHSGSNSESGITYDAIGNILTLVRGGDRAESFSYSYNASTKRLSSISVSGSTKSYAYDAAGNVTTDGIRGMTITYNPIEMPYTITKGSDVLTYIYDAGGNKLATKLNGTVQNYYSGDMVYHADGTIDYILTPEGRLTNESGIIIDC